MGVTLVVAIILGKAAALRAPLPEDALSAGGFSTCEDPLPEQKASSNPILQ